MHHDPKSQNSNTAVSSELTTKRTHFSCSQRRQIKHEWGSCHHVLHALMRENPLKTSSCYASACIPLPPSLSLLSPLLLGECLHTKWLHILYYKVYFRENQHEMIRNDLCPLSDWKIAHVIGFVFKRQPPYFIFMYYLQLAADASCHSAGSSGDWMSY